MADWLLGTSGILLGTFIVALGNGVELRRVPLFRRFGWCVLVIALLLLLITLVNSVAIPAPQL